jgi:hypothetical protein
VKAHVLAAPNQNWKPCHFFSSISRGLYRAAKHTTSVVNLSEKIQEDSLACYESSALL